MIATAHEPADRAADAIGLARDVRGLRWRSTRREHGDHVSAITIDSSTAIASVIASAPRKLPVTPESSASGANTTTVVNVVPITAANMSLVPSSIACAVGALLEPAHDALGDDDRVVDDEADRHREPAERHQIQRDAEPAHHGERPEQRQRHRHRGDEARAPVAQRERDHEQRQRDADQDRVAHARHRVADERRLIVDRRPSHVGRQRVLRAQRRERILHAVDDGRRARAGQPRDRHRDDLAARARDDDVGILGAVADIGDRRQRHRPGGPFAIGSARSVSRSSRLRVEHDRQRLVLIPHAAGRDHLVLRLDLRASCAGVRWSAASCRVGSSSWICRTRPP